MRKKQKIMQRIVKKSFTLLMVLVYIHFKTVQSSAITGLMNGINKTQMIFMI